MKALLQQLDLCLIAVTANGSSIYVCAHEILANSNCVAGRDQEAFLKEDRW